MAEDLALYLRLAPEFGGTRFGPFEGAEVRLGSDPERNDITLPEALGVIGGHVKIIRQSDQNLILAPVERSAAVFVWSGNSQRPKQVSTPIAVRSGDSFALVTANGPRFFVEIAELPPEIQEQRAKERARRMGRGRLSAGAFKQEGKRQVWANIVATGPGQMANRAYTFVRSGAIFMPRNIFMMVGILGGYFIGFGQCISKASLEDAIASQGEELESCKDEVAFAESMGDADSASYKFTELARAITGVGALGPALEEDATLLAAVKQASTTVFANASDYEWLTNPRAGKGKAGDFAKLREALLEEEDISGDTARLLAYAASVPGRSRKDWVMISDSNGDDVCGRGPLALTFRQAQNLGLNPRLDALLTKGVEPYQEEGGRALRLEALSATAAAAGVTELEELTDDLESEIDPVRQGREACLHVSGNDNRTRTNALVRAIAKHLGDDAAELPGSEVNRGVTARLAKLYAADMDLVDFSERNSGLDLSSAPVGAVMEGEGPRGQWVIKRTAETVARAMVLPCIAVLNNGDDPGVAATFGEDLPSPVNCLVLDWKLRHGE